MANSNIEVVEQLPNGKKIIKITREIKVQEEIKKIIKFTIADENGIVPILDTDGELTGIQFFDNYALNEFGDIIIGIQKEVEEYLSRILSKYDLSETGVQVTEAPGGPFNIGPYAKPYYEYEWPTKKLEDIVPQSYSFNYGVINRDGLLSIYPTYDYMRFGNENTCIVGLLTTGLKCGYNDLTSGSAITPVCFNEAMDFSEGRARILYKNRYGYLDRNKVMNNPENHDEYAENLAPQFFKATEFENGTAMVVINKGNHFNNGSMRAKIDLNGGIIEFLPPARVSIQRKRNRVKK